MSYAARLQREAGQSVHVYSESINSMEAVPVASIVADPAAADVLSHVPLVMELETGDPDDILALLFILQHPRARLKAVVMSTGSPDQIGLIKHLFTKYHHPDIPVGAFNLHHPKPTVSAWHYKTLAILKAVGMPSTVPLSF